MTVRRVRSRDLSTGATNKRSQGAGSVDRRVLDKRAVGGQALAAGAVRRRNYEPRGSAERHVDPSLIPRDLYVIDMGDAAVVTGYSKSHRPLRTGTMRTLAGSLEGVGSTDTVANVIRNGASIGTFTIPAGELFWQITDTGWHFDAFDRWQIQVTTAGTGALALTYFARIA